MVPSAGMVVSVRTRQDVVIADPERFLAAARAAYRDLTPGATEEEAAEHVHDVRDAVFVLLERFGRLAADPHPAPSEGPGLPAPERPDGLSPAGDLTQLVFDDPGTLRGYGCFLPEDPFALPPTP